MVVHKQRVEICNKTLIDSDQSRPNLLGAGGSRFREGGGFGAGDDFVGGEGDLGAGDGEREGGDGERMMKRIFSNDAQPCAIVFPSRSYSIAK